MPLPATERFNVCRAIRDGSTTAMSATDIWLGIQDSNLDQLIQSQPSYR